jgi:2-oxoglutarate dehydrogenase E2 component (dihydrolipoamide succinyltransferase)
MPQLGETIVEGTILRWLKKEGDAVERDEPLFEISTDKVDTEVPSPVAGTVTKILVDEGQTVPVGTQLMEIDDGSGGGVGGGDSGDASAGDRDTSQSPQAAKPPSPAPTDTSAEREPSPVSAPATAEGTPEATSVAPAAASIPLPDRGPRSQILSPLVRRLAEEHDLDLARIAGTGTGGRITKRDVEAVIAAGGERAPAAAAHPSAATAPALAPALAPIGAGEEIVPMTHIRKAIAQHMLGSLQVSARAWTMVEVNVENLVRLRERSKESFQEKFGVKLTYLPFVVSATCDALLEHPMVNAELRGEDLVVRRFVNMGIAVSYDQGLIVPVIKGADSMNVPGLARAIADLAARARAHQLKPDEVQGSTFTITNPGPYGSLASVPIISQPNSAILSLDAIQKRPVVVDDAIAIRHVVYVSMSWDHRVLDGEVATRFLGRVKQNLESWDFAESLGL